MEASVTAFSATFSLIILLWVFYLCMQCLCHMTCFLLDLERCELWAHFVFILFFPPQRKENNNIFVDDLKEQGEKRPIPKPCRTFLEAFERYSEVMDNIRRVGFEKPTPIQVQVTCAPSLCLCFFFFFYKTPDFIVAACEVVHVMTWCCFCFFF